MKISDLNLLNLDIEEGTLTLEQFNDTKTNYPSDCTIHQLVAEIAAKHPDKVAVRDYKGEEITYKELIQASDTLAHFLIDKNIEKEEPIALWLDASVNRVIALLGILKAGGAYVALNEDFPFKRNRYILEDTKAKVLISEKKYLKELNRLQWQTKSLHILLCMDSDAIYEEEETINELMDKDLWDFTGEKATDDIAAGGWVNSYTGEDLSREIMDEYGDNILKKLKPILKSTDKVLEIGCSSGISMFRLAPLVAEYHGTDLSDEILKKTEHERVRRSLDNINLYTTPAHEVDGIGEEGFDVVIINSVIQCFEGLHYLRKVLSKAIDLLKAEGTIFLGDLMDADTKDAFLESLMDFKNEHAGEGFVSKLDWSNELFVSKSFFNDLPHDFPSMAQVQHSEKIYTIANELTDFRYDTLITIDKKVRRIKKEDLQKKQRYQLDRSSLLRFSNKGSIMPYGHSRSLAYIAYTSGTTGMPKGVLVEHRSVVRLVRNTNYIKINSLDNMLQTAPLSFDAATFELWGALLNGASLFMVEKNDLLDAKTFGGIMTKEKITISWLTSSLFNQLVEQNTDIFQHLRCLLIGGDVLSPQHVNLLTDKYANLEIINGYGPTENTTFSTTFLIDRPYQKSIPIGKPIANTQCYILDDAMELVPVGVNGNLYVAGHGLARGYLNDPLATKNKFVDSPFEAVGKLYNTGDIAKWLPDGNIRFIGRDDNQVKIRGFRIELGEVENKIKEITGLKNVLVTIEEEGNKDKYLCAYIATKINLNIEEIKKELQGHLPAYMVPTYIINVGIFQLNTSGKIDLRVLPDPKDSRFLLEKDLLAPRNQLEGELLKIWKEVLAIPTVSINENFFSVGGHSLKATQVVSRIRKTMVLDISIRDIFANPTIASLSLFLQQKNKIKFQEIPQAETKVYYEMSPSQKRLWVLDQFEAERLSYNMPGAFILDGLDRDIFQKAFEVLLERHESLRTVFVEIDGVPKQKVIDIKVIDFKMVNIDLMNQPDREAKAKALAEEEATTEFDLAKGPLLRVKLIQLEVKKFMFLFTMHHIISDGWSLKVMVKEITTLYNAFSKGEAHNLKALPVQYKDFSEWQAQQLSGEALQKQRNYWLEQLGPDVTTLELPTDYLRQALKTSNGKSLFGVLDKALQQEIYTFGEMNGASPFMTLLALTKILLYRYSGQGDIVVGTPIAGRQHEDLESQIGFFINTLALRTQLTGQDSFTDVLQQVKNHTLDAYEHQIYPFDQLVEDLSLPRDLSRNPVFDVMVTFQNTGLENALDQPMEGVVVTPCESGVLPSKFDLSLTFEELSQGLALQVEYNTDLFKESRITRMLTHFEALTQYALAHSDEAVDTFDYLLEDEKERLLAFGASDASFQTPQGLLQLFQAQCKTYPNKTAILDEGIQISFQELQVKANKLAHQLKDVYGVATDDFVAVVMGRSTDIISTALAIFKLGAVYVPMDPSFPKLRLAYMLQDNNAKVILTDTVTGTKLKSVFGDKPVLDVVQLQKESIGMPATDPVLSYDEERIAYVIYTSGSSGKPKGVMIGHGAMSNFLHAMQACLEISGKDLLIAVNTPSFDISILEMFLPLMTGASILMASPETTKDPYLLMELMNKHSPTLMHATPSLWQTLINVNWAGDKQMAVICGGEVLSLSLGKNLLRKTKKLWNSYGPTEITVGCTLKLVKEEKDIQSIGKPINYIALYVLDENDNLVPIGVDGELCVGGNSLSSGYLNLLELTQERFVANPYRPSTKMYRTGDMVRWLENGDIRFIGRKDKQVKVNGYRIELGEIEHALNQLDAVSQALALVLNRKGEKELVTYIVASRETDAEQLRSDLSLHLPHYMIPHHFVMLDSFPLMVNGKIDQKALPNILEKGQNDKKIGPRNEREETVTKIWKDILGLSAVGIHDNFFAVGGHSLKATQVMSKILQELDVKIRITELFSAPTIAGISELVAKKARFEKSKILPIALASHYELSHAQHRLWVQDQMGEGQIAFNVPGMYYLKAVDNIALTKAFAVLVERHEVLRTTFVTVDETPKQLIHQADEFPFELEFEDLRTQVLGQEQIEAIAQKEAQTPFQLDKGPLFRARLLQLTDDDHALLYTMHHIICDGWSMDIMVNELMALYDSFVQGKQNPLPPLPIQYKDYAYWEREQMTGDTLKEYKQFWTNRLRDLPLALELPIDFTRPDIQSFEGRLVNFDLDKKTSLQLEALCNQHQLTLFMAFFAIVRVFLYKYTDQSDMTIGTMVSGRAHQELENLIGFFVNMIVIRGEAHPDMHFDDYLTKTKDELLEAYEHQVYPFDKLVADLEVPRNISRNPLFDVVVAVDISAEPTNENGQQHPNDEFDAIKNAEVNFEIGSKFDLMFHLIKTGEAAMKIQLSYNSSLFKEETIALIKERLIRLIQDAVSHPQKKNEELQYTIAQKNKLAKAKTGFKF